MDGFVVGHTLDAPTCTCSQPIKAVRKVGSYAFIACTRCGLRMRSTNPPRARPTLLDRGIVWINDHTLAACTCFACVMRRQERGYGHGQAPR